MEPDSKILGNNITGILLFAGAVFLIVVMNGFAKMASEYHHPIEMVFYRGVVAMTLLLLLARMLGKEKIYRTNRIRTHMLRGLIGNIGVVMVFWAYALMPMADVTAILFCAPLMVTAMSAIFLKENVDKGRWIAVIVGFLGVLMIVQPTGAAIYSVYGVLVSLAAAFSTAIVSIFLRDLGRTEDSLTTVFYFLAFGIIFSGVYMIFIGNMAHPDAVWLLAAIGVAAFMQLVLKTQAHKIAEASLLSPISYSSIVWATLFGWMFWDELPSIQVVAGAAIIIASNIFISRQEGKKKAQIA
jgi:drug/metabolite transporter (DMT)-like permease